jgi:histidine triad (HIT) family protein
MGSEKTTQRLFTLSKTALGDFIVGLAFGKLSSLLPVKRVMETDKVIAFWHPSPSFEKHILIVPKKPIKGILDLTAADFDIMTEVYTVTGQIVRDLGLDEAGYSLICNGGKRQEVHQLHFHLTSGTLLTHANSEKVGE